MAKDSGTRSGLLWEVERILKECKQLPQVLIMENVPQVVGKKNMPYFADWLKFLDDLGYKSKWQILNATGYGVPQNRERCFMVSVLGDYFYNFPQAIGCDLKLKDVLETNVPESYYLKKGTIIKLAEHKARHEAQGHGFGWKPIDPDGGGQFVEQLKPRLDTDRIQTLLLKDQGKTLVKMTESANTITARDYKGFGNQAMNAVIELPPPRKIKLTESTLEKAKVLPNRR